MPETPPPPSGIDKKIADAVANEDYELAAKLNKVKTQPPPPPPKKGKKAPPPPPPKKGKKAPPPSGKPKGRPKDRTRRRRRLRLKMRSTTIADEEDSYTDRIGWNTSVGTVLEDNEEIVEEPKTITHQCSMCGSMMTVPKPKRERYRIVCTYPQCGHSDTVGI
jgi:hypothetical protein